MSKCKYVKCDNEAIEGQSYCSKSCRAQHSRRNKQAAQHLSLALPGDPDYVGVCEEVDGQWQVKSKPESEPIQLLAQPMLDSLPVGVVRPTGQPTTYTRYHCRGTGLRPTCAA